MILQLLVFSRTRLDVVTEQAAAVHLLAGLHPTGRGPWQKLNLDDLVDGHDVLEDGNDLGWRSVLVKLAQRVVGLGLVEAVVYLGCQQIHQAHSDAHNRTPGGEVASAERHSDESERCARRHIVVDYKSA
jgi:hypothetical protein